MTILTSDTSNPKQDGRYGVIYRQGSVVRRFVSDYSVTDGWLVGMPRVEILAWWELPQIPTEIISKVMEA